MTMSYRIKEIFYTLQGEGRHAGRAAVFCRFSGCNLWSGREEDRALARCAFCDTDFLGVDGPGGGLFEHAQAVVDALLSNWQTHATRDSGRPFVVFTGGEPLLQLDDALVTAAHDSGFEVAIETNGTRLPPRGIDWICMSPKAGVEVVLRTGNELKLVYPQPGAEPEKFEQLEFQHFYLQPMDGPELARNTRMAVDYCLAHPHWRLSLQTHKILGIP
jgi:7-carboxy-7-deazaguanine synthase (Cx14CxxC type)